MATNVAVRTLCVEKTRQIVRDPSSWHDCGGHPPLPAVYPGYGLTSTPASCGWALLEQQSEEALDFVHTMTAPLISTSAITARTAQMMQAGRIARPVTLPVDSTRRWPAPATMRRSSSSPTAANRIPLTSLRLRRSASANLAAAGRKIAANLRAANRRADATGLTGRDQPAFIIPRDYHHYDGSRRS